MKVLEAESGLPSYAVELFLSVSGPQAKRLYTVSA